MKTLPILALATLLSLTAAAQQEQLELEVPKIETISVNDEGVPVIKWSYHTRNLVDGFIIKRRIVDGVGVVSGTYNNVAVIENKYAFIYTDTSNEYGTYAMPLVRKEYYCIAAYKTDESGRKHYSLMSDPVATILAQGHYDYCNEQFDFNFSSMEGDGKYAIRQTYPDSVFRYTGTDTSASIKFRTYAESRDFQIEWAGSNYTSKSPTINVKAQKPAAPDTTRIFWASADENGHITLKITASHSESSRIAQLYRRNITTGAESIIQLPDSVMHDYIYTDNEANSSERYAYLLTIYDKCGQQLSQSDSTYNIVATAAPGEHNTNLVQWNSARKIEGGISSNNIFRQINNGEWEQISDVSEFYNEYQDHLSNMIADSKLYNGEFCYQVQVVCNNGDKILSNIACMQREPVIYIPNALNANSTNMENRVFRPRADFLQDYHLAIYDKRGAIIFQTDDINEGWDGYDRTSKLCTRDTYMYHITYKTASGKAVAKSGMVNLLY